MPDAAGGRYKSTMKRVATSGDVEDDAEMRRPEVKHCRFRAVAKMDAMMGHLIGFFDQIFGATPSVWF